MQNASIKIMIQLWCSIMLIIWRQHRGMKQGCFTKKLVLCCGEISEDVWCFVFFSHFFLTNITKISKHDPPLRFFLHALVWDQGYTYFLVRQYSCRYKNLLRRHHVGSIRPERLAQLECASNNSRNPLYARYTKFSNREFYFSTLES